jgi:hypothetical protein
MEMDPTGIDFLTKRGINPEVAASLGVTSGNGILVFEYRDKGELIQKAAQASERKILAGAGRRRKSDHREGEAK